MEYFNEAMLMITGYHLFCFSDFVPDVETREQVGLSLMACTIFSVSVNLAVTLINPVYGIKKLSYKIYLRLRYKTFKKYFKSEKPQDESKEPQKPNIKEIVPNYREIVKRLPDNNHPDLQAEMNANPI